MNRRLLGIGALLVLVGLAGCAQISTSVTVAEDGVLEEYEVTINTSTTVYGLLSEQAKEDGYDNLRDQLTSDINESRYDELEYDEEINGDDATIYLRLEEFEPGSGSSISITRSDGQLVYEDTTWLNESAEESEYEELMSGMVLEYRLTMPGEITDSNADEVNSNTATWTATGADAYTNTRIYAESDVPSGLLGTDFGAGAVAIGVGGLVVGAGLVVGLLRLQ